MLRRHRHRLGILHLRRQGNESQVQDGTGHKAVPSDLRRGYQQRDSADRARQDLDDTSALGRSAAEFRTTRDTAISAQIKGAMLETSPMGQSAESVTSSTRSKIVRHQRLVDAVRGRYLDAGSSYT